MWQVHTGLVLDDGCWICRVQAQISQGDLLSCRAYCSHRKMEKFGS